MKRVCYLRLLHSPRVAARIGPLLVMFWPDRRWWKPEIRWRTRLGTETRR